MLSMQMSSKRQKVQLVKPRGGPGLLHCIWRNIRQPFIFPEFICTHKDHDSGLDSWEVYDCNAAGCKMCGSKHVCSQLESTCIVEKNSEGHEICLITGFCIKMLSFSDLEFLNSTMSFSQPAHLPPTEEGKHHASAAADVATNATSAGNKKNRYRSWVHQRIQMNQQLLLLHGIHMPQKPSQFHEDSGCSMADRIRSLIDVYVREIICSSRWSQCMVMEVISFFACCCVTGPKLIFIAQEHKLNTKKKSLMLKAMKVLKLARKSGEDLISIPEAVRLVACSLQGIRCSSYSQGDDTLLSSKTRESVSTWCSETIHRHLCLMNSVCDGIITETRLQNVTVGLLYLLRTGIIVHDIVVLPQLRILNDILPMESHLGTFFGVRAKCITETENVVKIILRNISKQQLINAGVAHVACKLVT